MYTTSFRKPSAGVDAYRLLLGDVHNTAEVSLNGIVLDTLIGPDFSVLIPSTLLKRKNRLVVTVSNGMANRIIWMDKHDMNWKIFYNINMSAGLRENLKNGIFDASRWTALPSGISGQPILVPLKNLAADD